jgi:hypothetical protein
MTIAHEIERDEVMAYLDGELAAARAGAVRDHLDRCAECSALADDLRGVSSGLSDWQVEPAPDRLVAPAGAAPDRSSFGRAGWKTWLMAPSFFGVSRWAIAAAGATAVIALVVAGQVLLRQRPKSDLSVLNGELGNGRLTPQRQAGDRTRSLGYTGPSVTVTAAAPVVDTKKTTVGTTAPRDTNQIVAMTPGVSSGFNVQSGAADAQMMVQTATMSLSTETFDAMRPALERVAAAHHGSVAALALAGDPPNRRTLNATLRVPVAEMDATLAGVRALGKVLQESQSTEDVTDAHRDLAIRISNAKVEEAKLDEILKNRTGRLSDVLAVEQAQSRVRTEIEQMEAQELAMRNRAALSTITVDVAERYRAELSDTDPLPVGIRLRNAVVDGARVALDSVVSLALAILGAAPAVLLWAALLFWPARWGARKIRRRASAI